MHPTLVPRAPRIAAMVALNQIFCPEPNVPVPAAIERAIEQHLVARGDLESWKCFEESAAGQEFPEWVARTYLEILRECEQSGAIPEELIDQAFQHCNEWFGTVPEDQAPILIALAQLAPAHRKIFDQCTVTLTHAQLWDDLLRIHDLRAEVLSPQARQETLEQAAQIAQDFGQDLDRALAYYATILESDPGNDRIFTLFVRLVSRQQAWSVYAEALAKRAPSLDREAAQAALLGRAQLLVEKLENYPQALEQFAQVLQQDPKCQAALEAISSIADNEELPLQHQRQAMELLFSYYQSQLASNQALDVVYKHIAAIAPLQDLQLEHTRLSLLAHLGRGECLAKCSSELFLAYPDDEVAQSTLRELLISDASAQQSSKSLLFCFQNWEGAPPIAVVDLLVIASQCLIQYNNSTDLVARAMLRVFEDQSLDQLSRQQAAATFQCLSDDLREQHEDLALLEMQFSLAQDASKALALLERQAARCEREGDEDRSLAVWQRALQIAPAHRQAQERVEEQLRKREDWNQLADHILHSIEHAEDSERALQLELKIVHIDIQHRDSLDAGLDRLRALLSRYPGREDLSQQYYDSLCEHERFATLVDWLRPRSFERRDVAEIVDCGQIYLRRLEDQENCARCVQEALAIRPEHADARELGLELLAQAPSFETASLAKSLWRSFLLVDIQSSQIQAFVTITDACKDPEVEAQIWLDAEARFEHNPKYADARFECLLQVLKRQASNMKARGPWQALAEQCPEYAARAYACVAQALQGEQMPTASAASLWDLAAELAVHSQDDVIGRPQILKAHLQSWRLLPNDERHRLALGSAVACQDWDALVELTLDTQDRGPVMEPSQVWSLVCKQDHPAPEDVPRALVTKFAQALSQLQGSIQRDRAEWIWNIAKLLAHHQEFLPARELSLPLAQQKELPIHHQRLRSIYAWLRMDPPCEQESLALADRLAQILELNVEERRAHASLDRKLRGPGELALQIAAWDCCERAICSFPGEEGPPASVVAAMRESLSGYIAIALSSDQRGAAVRMATRALALPLPFQLHEELFSLSWNALGYAHEPPADATFGSSGPEMLELLLADRHQLLELGVGYDQAERHWRAELLTGLLRQQRRYFECMEVLSERLERAEQQGPPNTPQMLLDLRLAISTTVRELSRDDGHLRYLLENLNAVAAHPESLQRACKLLRERGDHEGLAKLWSDQAAALIEHHQGDPKSVHPRAADLWCLAAQCYEERLDSPERAAQAYEQARKLVSRTEILDNLIRIYSNEPCLDKGRAASHLHRRLDLASHDERLPLSYRLASLYLEISQARQSRSVLEEVFEPACEFIEFRRIYLQTIDELNAPAEMLKARVRLSGRFNDEELRQATSTATRLLSQLDDHEVDLRELLPLLEQSAPKRPKDLLLQKHFVSALSAADRHQDAMEHLEGLLQAQGRRRSPERAALHSLLGQQYAKAEKLPAACKQFEQAALMDPSQSRRWIEVARLSEELGHNADAERALRTLLVHSQKRLPGDLHTPTSAWVLLQLYFLNTKEGQEEVALRHWDSCRDRCMQDLESAREVLSELAEHEELHGQYLDLAERMLDEELASDFKAEILAQRSEHLEGKEDFEGAFEMILLAMSHDASSAAICATAIRLAEHQEKLDALHAHLDRILARSQDEGESLAAHNSQRLMLLCTKARLLARDKAQHEEAQALLDQAAQLELRPIELLRARHDVYYQLGNIDKLREALEAMHRHGVLSQERMGDSWLRQAEQYAARPENVRLALRAIHEALDEGASPRSALDIMLAFPPADSQGARAVVLSKMQSLAHELCDEDALLKILHDRLENQSADASHLRRLYELSLSKKAPEIARQSIQYALDNFCKAGEDDSHWAIWAFVDECLNDQTPQDETLSKLWTWVHFLVREGKETQLRERIDTMLARGWQCYCQDKTMELLELLVEKAATHEPYREALWKLCEAQGDGQALLSVTRRNLALLSEARDRNQLRERFVASSWNYDDLAQDRVEMLRAILTEEPGNASAQNSLVEHYRCAGELKELETLLLQWLAEARETQDSDAQTQLGLSLAKLYYESDRLAGLKLCRELLDQSEAPMIEISQTCIQWCTHPDAAEHFADAFEDNQNAEDKLSAFSSFLLARYQEVMEQGDQAQRFDAARHAAQLLEDADCVDESISLLVEFATQNGVLAAIQPQLFEVYQRHDRFAELACLLREQAQSSEDPSQAYQLIRSAAQITYEKLGQVQEAIEILDSATLDPHSPEHYERLQYQVRYLEDAKPEELLRRLDVGLPSVESLGHLRPQAGATPEFLEALGDVELQATRAQILFEEQQHEDALIIYRFLAIANPERYRHDWVRCQSAHLDALIDGDDKELAKEAWQNSVRSFLSGDDKDTQDNGERLSDLGLRLAAQGLRDHDFLESFSELAAHRQDSELRTRALEWSRESSDPEVRMRALVALIDQSVQAADYDKARDYLDQGASGFEEHPEYTEQKKRIYLLQEDYAQLAKLEYACAQSMQDECEAALAFKQAASHFERASDEQGRKEALQQAVARSPEDYSIHLDLVRIEMQSENTPAATDLTDKALEIIPKGREHSALVAELSYIKSKLLGAQDQGTEQMEWLQKAHNLDRNNVEIASSLAILAEAREEWDLASRALRQLANLGAEQGAPPASELCLRQAKLWRAAKDLRKASFWAHKARHAAPDSAEIHELLEALAAEQKQAAQE